jgi:hypothetical protein
MKQGSLFCFVLSHWDLPIQGASCCAFGIFGELFWWVEVHLLSLRLFEAKVWKLFVYWIIFSMKTKQNWNWKLYWDWGLFLLFLEALSESDLIEFIS